MQMFSSKSISLIALRGISDAANFQRQILSDLLSYFLCKRVEDYRVYEERFQNFKCIMQAVTLFQVEKTLFLIKEAIEKYGQGQRTTRYANLLAKMQCEIEKYGLDFFEKYFTNMDWETGYIPPYDHVVRMVLSKNQVYQHHVNFRDAIIAAFFTKIDGCVKETEKEIESYWEAIDSFSPRNEDSIIAFSLKTVQTQVVSLVYSVSRDVSLSKQKIVLLRNLKCNLLELLTEATDVTDINGFIRGLHFFLQCAMEENASLVASKNLVSEVKVNKLLTETMQLIEKYYPAEALFANQLFRQYRKEEQYT